MKQESFFQRLKFLLMAFCGWWCKDHKRWPFKIIFIIPDGRTENLWKSCNQLLQSLAAPQKNPLKMEASFMCLITLFSWKIPMGEKTTIDEEIAWWNEKFPRKGILLSFTQLSQRKQRQQKREFHLKSRYNSCASTCFIVLLWYILHANQSNYFFFFFAMTI